MRSANKGIEEERRSATSMKVLEGIGTGDWGKSARVEDRRLRHG
jgi:hypothetical protein